MQHELLKYLKCPITKTALRFEPIKEFEKQYLDGLLPEICDGLLFSETGFVFPVIDGIPRMTLEAIYDYSGFLEKHLNNYQETKRALETNFSVLLRYCIAKNSRTKESFEFEWSFLDSSKKDKIWHGEISALLPLFSEEVGESTEYFKNKKLVDVGCGHGIMTSTIGAISEFAIGVELSKSVEKAYRDNTCSRAWYVQADLQFLPFGDATFDLLYCSGVIHHTNNTELSLLLIEPILKPTGKICLWLYHPQKSIIHNLFLALRNFTKRLPLKITFIFLCIFVFPISYTIKRLKGNNPNNYREELIDLLDHFTPEFRFEIPDELAKIWLMRKHYSNIKVTTKDKFGFAIVGDKTAVQKEL